MFKAGFPVFAFFKDELEARKLFKAFFYSQNYKINILWNVFFLFAVRKCLKAF